METERMLELRARMKADNKKWVATVVNENEIAGVITEFDSEETALENVLHKIELDLMTNLHLDLRRPITIFIQKKR